MNNFKIFDVRKSEKELKKICREYDLPTTAIDLITNLMEVYNNTLAEIETGTVNRVFFLSQISGQIFNMCKEFKLTPPRKSLEIGEEETKLDKIKKKIASK